MPMGNISVKQNINTRNKYLQQLLFFCIIEFIVMSRRSGKVKKINIYDKISVFDGFSRSNTCIRF